MPASARRGPWSTAEDAYLLQIVQTQGANNWVRISQLVRTRTPKQCRERFHQNLKPTLNHDPITPDEGELIERLVGEMGKKWAEIARQLNGRSDNAVKNWWNGGQNRRRRMSDRRRSDHRDRQVSGAQHSSLYPPHYHHHHHQHHQHHQHQHAMNSVESMPYYTPQDSYHNMHRPSPLSIQPHPYGRVYDTPIPSPSGQSVISNEGAPSLITDNGSESRSPQYTHSPMEQPLPPLIGSRDERRRSSFAFLPRDGSFVGDDDQAGQLAPFRPDSLKKREILRLPEPQPFTSPPSLSPRSREPSFHHVPSRTPSLLLTAAHSHSHSHSHPRDQPVQLSPPAFPQRQLPGFHTLADSGRVAVPDARLALPPAGPSTSTSTSSSSYLAPVLATTATATATDKPRSPSTSKPNNVASILN